MSNRKDQQDPLEKKMVALERMMERAAVASSIASLTEPDTVRFNYEGQPISLYVPGARFDAPQREILMSGRFLDQRVFTALHELGVRFRDKVVFDVGANIGNHMVYFSRVGQAKHVYAFEPQAYCAEILKRNIDINNAGNARVFEYAVSNFNGSMRVSSFKSDDYGATRFEKDDEGPITCYRLDELIDDERLELPDFLKIDAVGNAPEVLTGAHDVIMDARPVIWIELWRKFQEVEPAIKFLEGAGYELVERLSQVDFLYAHPSNPI